MRACGRYDYDCLRVCVRVDWKFRSCLLLDLILLSSNLGNGCLAVSSHPSLHPLIHPFIPLA